MKIRLSPREKVLEAASLLVPEGTHIEVRGRRVKDRSGHFLAEVKVGEMQLAEARDRDWRRAYKSLCIELARRGVL